MGFRFQRRITILPGIHLNVSKGGTSWSFGGRGATVNVGKRGTTTTVGLPGTGLSYRSHASATPVTPVARTLHTPSEVTTPMPGVLAFLGVVAFCASILFAGNASYLWAAGLLAAAIALFWFRARWATAERAALAEQQAVAAAARERFLRDQRAALLARHGNDAAIVDRILAGETWVGQTAAALRDSLGEPEDVDEKVMKTRRREIWKYDRVTGDRYATRITVDDGIVVGWDKKD